MTCSTCETCRNPGRCCVGFALGLQGTREEIVEKLRTTRSALTSDGRPVALLSNRDFTEGETHRRKGLPFEPFYELPPREEDGAVFWRYWCPKLGRDGRCTIYADRPALCVAYEPKSDALCAEFDP